MSVSAQARRIGTTILRHRGARRAALRIAAAGGRALVLLYHRIDRDRPGATQFVPSIPAALFRRQLQALQAIGEIVPLQRVLRPAGSPATLRFAITFDDDDARHVRHALPVLEAVGAAATFFLSGRALHALPSYWWTLLEHSLEQRGFAATQRLLGLPGHTPSDLAFALECSPRAAQIVEVLDGPTEPPMTLADMRALAHAGMTIGFHTLRHPIVSRLDGAALSAALTEGRQDLETAIGVPVRYFAYPFGRTSPEAAAAAEHAGFDAAFTTGGRPITAASDTFLLSRWEPGCLDGEAFTAAVALRLLRPPTPPRRRRARRTEYRP